MKQYRHPVVKFLTVSDSLGHSLGDIQPLHSLDLRVYAGYARNIWGTAKTDSLPRLGVYPVGLEYAANFRVGEGFDCVIEAVGSAPALPL